MDEHQKNDQNRMVIFQFKSENKRFLQMVKKSSQYIDKNYHSSNKPLLDDIKIKNKIEARNSSRDELTPLMMNDNRKIKIQVTQEELNAELELDYNRVN